MAFIRCRQGFRGDPQVFLPALHRAESADPEGDGPQSGSGSRCVPADTSSHRQYGYGNSRLVFLVQGWAKCFPKGHFKIVLKAVTVNIYLESHKFCQVVHSYRPKNKSSFGVLELHIITSEMFEINSSHPRQLCDNFERIFCLAMFFNS